MKIIVPIKRVEDPETKIQIAADQKSVVDGGKFVINPWDEIALEEALRLRDVSQGEVVVITAGVADASTQLRTALAIGADRAIHIVTEHFLDPHQASMALAAAIAPEKPDLVLMGKQALDDDAGQTGGMLAELLNYPHATSISKEASLDSASEKNKTCALMVQEQRVTVMREVDGGMESLALALPALLTCELRLNIPRYASLPGIMKAKKKEIKEIKFNTLVANSPMRCVVIKLETPPARQGGTQVSDVATLVHKLRSEAKVL